ncbi:unnamed protein product, partial [Didymodactylos carnosus]
KYNQRPLITKNKNNNLFSIEDGYNKQSEENSNFISRLKTKVFNRPSRQRLEESTPNKLEDKTRTLPHWTIYIAWTLVILSILTCSFFVILYSMEWGKTRSNEWLTTMMLSFGQSILVIDPLKVLFSYFS